MTNTSEKRKRRHRQRRKETRRELSHCPKCGRATPEPIRGQEAAAHRNHMRLAGLGSRGEELAYAWCISTVILTTENHHLVCSCDRENWENAIVEYRKGGKSLWLELGVTDELMVEVEMIRAIEMQLLKPSLEPVVATLSAGAAELARASIHACDPFGLPCLRQEQTSVLDGHFFRTDRGELFKILAIDPSSPMGQDVEKVNSGLVANGLPAAAWVLLEPCSQLN